MTRELNKSQIKPTLRFTIAKVQEKKGRKHMCKRKEFVLNNNISQFFNYVVR